MGSWYLSLSKPIICNPLKNHIANPEYFIKLIKSEVIITTEVKMIIWLTAMVGHEWLLSIEKIKGSCPSWLAV